MNNFDNRINTKDHLVDKCQLMIITSPKEEVKQLIMGRAKDVNKRKILSEERKRFPKKLVRDDFVELFRQTNLEEI